MQTAAAVIGVLVVVAALVGFFRSLWRPPGRRGDGGEGPIAGESVTGGHGGADGGSH